MSLVSSVGRNVVGWDGTSRAILARFWVRYLGASSGHYDRTTQGASENLSLMTPGIRSGQADRVIDLNNMINSIQASVTRGVTKMVPEAVPRIVCDILTIALY
jgi:hypothetical protein